MKKITISLFAIVLFLAPVSTFAKGMETKISFSEETFESMPGVEEKHSIEFDEGIYDVYKYKQSDGSIKVDVRSPEGDIEKFNMIEDVIYDKNKKVLATIERKFIESKDEGSSINALASFRESATSPYPSSDYTRFQGTEQGNIHLNKQITSFTVAALALIVSILAPPLSTPIAAMLIYKAINLNINSSAIFYKKHRWFHKNLGQLHQQLFLNMYWDPNFSNKAGDTQIYYRIWS